MKYIIATILFTVLASCGRYHNIPRASKDQKTAVRQVSLLATSEPQIIKPKDFKNEAQPTVEDCSTSTLQIFNPAEPATAQENNTIVQNSFEKKAPEDSLTKKSIRSNNKYERLRKYTLGSMVMTIIGIICTLIGEFSWRIPYVLADYILSFGVFFFGLGLILILLLCVAFLITYLSDIKDRRSEEDQPKEEPSKEEPAKEEPAKDEPAKEEPAKEVPSKGEPAKEEPAKDEPAKGEPAKEEQPKEKISNPKKTRQPANNSNYLFFYFLIANLIIWALTKLKIKH